MYVNARAIIERNNNGLEIVIQTRHKPYEGSDLFELPGGQVDEFESLVITLQREVKEETGLTITQIEGSETRLQSVQRDSIVECLRPFAVYQTLQGPVDSMGVYFRCQAKGTLLAKGDEAKDSRWVPIDQLAKWVAETPESFSWVDLAGIRFYLNEQKE